MMTRTPSAQAHAEQQTKGFTLTEIAIVLGIIGLILGAIWVAAAGVYNSQRVSHANTAVLQVVQGTRTLLSTSSTVGAAGDITQTIVQAGVIPSDLVNGVAAIGPWPASTLKILTNAATDTSFTFELTKVPRAACIALFSTLGGSSRDQGLSNAGSTTASAPIAVGTAGTALPLATLQIAIITPAIATAACSNATNNLVQLEYTLK